MADISSYYLYLQKTQAQLKMNNQEVANYNHDKVEISLKVKEYNKKQQEYEQMLIQAIKLKEQRKEVQEYINTMISKQTIELKESEIKALLEDKDPDEEVVKDEDLMDIDEDEETLKAKTETMEVDKIRKLNVQLNSTRQEQLDEIAAIEEEIRELEEEQKTYQENWVRRQERFVRILRELESFQQALQEEKEEQERREGMQSDSKEDA